MEMTKRNMQIAGGVALGAISAFVLYKLLSPSAPEVEEKAAPPLTEK